jgi:hypothetical protein
MHRGRYADICIATHSRRSRSLQKSWRPTPDLSLARRRSFQRVPSRRLWQRWVPRRSRPHRITNFAETGTSPHLYLLGDLRRIRPLRSIGMSPCRVIRPRPPTNPPRLAQQPAGRQRGGGSGNGLLTPTVKKNPRRRRFFRRTLGHDVGRGKTQAHHLDQWGKRRYMAMDPLPNPAKREVAA